MNTAAKGQGRAIVALQSGQFQPALHDLRRLVLRWPGDDAQCETTRGWYTAELMRASDHESVLCDLVIRHLGRTKGPRRDQSHRKAIVAELAKRGNLKANDALHAGFDPADEFRLAGEILEAEGLVGLDWLITHSDGYLVPESAWILRWWVEDLQSAYGDDMVLQWLEKESAHRGEVATFKRLLAEEPPAQKDHPKEAQISYDSLREQWAASEPGQQISTSMWVVKASEDELRKAWKAFESELDPDWLRRIARGLKRKPKFANIDIIADRARSWNGDLNPFVSALEEIKDERLRQLGLDLAQAGRIEDGVAILATNASPGDEPVIVAALRTITDDGHLHVAGMDVLRMSDDLDTFEMLLWVYEQTPCSFCREGAVDNLIKSHNPPAWLLQECLWDCVADTREMARALIA